VTRRAVCLLGRQDSPSSSEAQHGLRHDPAALSSRMKNSFGRTTSFSSSRKTGTRGGAKELLDLRSIGAQVPSCPAVVRRLANPVPLVADNPARTEPTKRQALALDAP
jgi:hypothetical protein